MSGPRRDRILAGTALVLILGAVPFELLAQDREATAKVPASAVENAAPPAKSGEPAATIDGTASTPTPAAATEQTAAPDPLALVDPADRPVAEKIRDFLAAKTDRIFASKNERAAVETFYQSRNFVAIWLDKGIEIARARAVIARLKDADADGLVASEYPTPHFSGLDAQALAEADIKLTQTVLTFARHLQAGRFPYNRLSNNIQLPQVPPEPAAVLAKMVEAADAGKALDEFSPPHSAYQKLKAKLAEMRGKAAGAEQQITDGPLLKPAVKNPVQDARVPLLRARLGVAGDPSDLNYDANVSAAVKKFQQASGLPPTGNLDARTIKELNGPTADRNTELVIANMERWRWYPRDLGADHVIVNQPEFLLRVMHNGSQIWTTRVVIGDTAPNKQTPLLSETLKTITVNPTWNVPPSIVYGEYLPAAARDPWVLQRMGLNVSYGRDGSIVHISQPPGGNNVLGRLRFNFPNRFLVYQHDTNERFMFAYDVRAQSHGCMRVQDPAKYAELLLNMARPNEHWTVEKVTRMYGGGEQDISLQPAQIWVHVTYQSAFVDDSGKLQVRRDIYNLDSRTIAAIRSERAVIETAPPEAKPAQEIASTAPRRNAAPQRYSSFFSYFFGGQPAQVRQTRPAAPAPRGRYY
jgi:L,D-transpeptidase YcbB